MVHKFYKEGKEIKLYTTGFLQVYFVALNTVFLAKELYIGVAFAAFAISWLWSSNVKRVAFGDAKDRAIYSFGAMAGSLAGLFTAKLIGV
jgi:hypothetical protein